MMNDHCDDLKKVRGNDAEVKICVYKNGACFFKTELKIQLMA